MPDQLELLEHGPSMVFVFCVGACVGSFLNVVIYRLPLRMSVVNPPSRCCTCGRRLSFFRENLPIIGWLMVRGQCRTCGARVSVRYMLVEVAIALLFLALYAVLYFDHGDCWLSEIGGSWWRRNPFVRSFPAYFVLALLIVGLIAMTVIDARTFEIPIEIPVFLTGAGFVLWPIQYLLMPRSPLDMTWPVPGVTWPWVLGGLLGLVGWTPMLLLLRVGRIRYSFADYHEYVEEGETLGDYPHARREVVRELGFLAPMLICMVVGWGLGSLIDLPPPRWLQALAAPLVGYFVGGGLVWAIRIFGTLGFGREAMGMGDVHLLAAVGAAVGWFDPILVFFIAPFVALAFVLFGQVILRLLGGGRRELPYGPHLAVATVVVLLGRPVLEDAWTAWSPSWPMPSRGFVVEEPLSPAMGIRGGNAHGSGDRVYPAENPTNIGRRHQGRSPRLTDHMIRTTHSG